MKIFFVLFAFMFSLILPLLSCAEVELASGIRPLKPDIIAYIERQAAKHNVNHSYVSSVITGDINGDKKKDLFVSYAVEGIGGGNFSLYYQALFITEGGNLVFKAERSNGSFGTAQGKTYVPKRIETGKIFCETLEYGPDDGVCCPSIKRTGIIFYKKGKLLEKPE